MKTLYIIIILIIVLAVVLFSLLKKKGPKGVAAPTEGTIEENEEKTEEVAKETIEEKTGE